MDEDVIVGGTPKRRGQYEQRLCERAPPIGWKVVPQEAPIPAPERTHDALVRGGAVRASRSRGNAEVGRSLPRSGESAGSSATARPLDRVTARTEVVPRKPFRPCGGRALCFLEVRSVNQMVIGMIGAGNMADALIKGLLSRHVLPPDAIWATNRSNRDRLAGLQARYGVQITPIKSPLLEAASLVVLAVNVREALLDVVTALPGSGPAYVYRLIEAMIHAGTDLGLDGELARRLAVQTLIGAARMLTESAADPGELRRKVTSPGGTTMAALGVLENRGFAEIVREAISRAAERAREMAGEFAVPDGQQVRPEV